MISGGFITSRREGDVIKVGDILIEFLLCDRGVSRVRVVADKEIKITVVKKNSLQSEDEDV